MLELLPNAIWKNILSQSGGCFFKNFPGGFSPRPICLAAPPTDLLLYNFFLQWFNILHKMLWNPGPMIFFIHFIFSIHIVSAVNAPYNAHHSINHFQRQIIQEIRFLDKQPFGRRAKFGCVYATLDVVIAKFFWGSMPPDPSRFMRLWRMRVAAQPGSQLLVHTYH